MYKVFWSNITGLLMNQYEVGWKNQNLKPVAYGYRNIANYRNCIFIHFKKSEPNSINETHLAQLFNNSLIQLISFTNVI